ncbi:MAG: HD domain-containing protein [Deltaproteobacteria bacterium]|nr:HD domain-containing protein [Deltaproteobacteria bacterium]
MKSERLRRLRREFVALSAEYEDRLGDRREYIVLKRDHSLRVHALAMRIVAGERLSRPELHWAAALVHDIGRFSQFERFGTYRDDESVDHGNEGAEVLLRGRFLDSFAPEDRARIVETVRLHNKRELPPGLDPVTSSLCAVVRDADKLDIVPVVLGKMSPDKPRDPVITLGLADEPESWTESIFEAVASDESPSYMQLRVVNDFKLLLASWGPKLEFATSRRLFARRGYLDRLFDLLPKAPCLAVLKADLDRRLAR